MAPKSVGAAGDPVGHVTAERAAHQRAALAVQIGALGRLVIGGHDVGVRLLAPACPAALNELQAVASRQGRVGHEHGVAAGGQNMQGFQRQCQPFHELKGPPCAQTTSGAGCCASAPVGTTSQDSTFWPSDAVAVRRSTRPGSSSKSSVSNERSVCFAPSLSWSRTGRGGEA